MNFPGLRISRRQAASIAVPLQMAGLLSALIFLISCIFELLVINDLYAAQHFLLALLLVVLSAWAIVEVAWIRPGAMVIPLGPLRLALWLQLLLAVVRGLIDLLMDPHPRAFAAALPQPDFGLALAFVPLDLVVFIVISRLIIDAFAYAEFQRANQLEQQMAALEQARQALQQSEQRYRLIADWLDDVIWTLDRLGCFTYISPSIEKLTAHRPEALLHQPAAAVLSASSVPLIEQAFQAALGQVQAGLPIEPFRAELEQICRDGQVIWTEWTMNGLYDPDQQFSGFVGVTRDIRERKLYDAELREARDAAEAANLALLSANAVLHGQATTDPLTGVSNRRHFEQALAAQISRTRSYGEPLSLLIVDLDEFKIINDRFGHQVGDRVIVELARLLKASVRKADLLARWGGDEFVVMLPHTGPDEALQLAEQLRLSVSVHVFPVVPKLTGSFGLAVLQAEETAEQFFARVDHMLYAAKAAGRNRVKLSG
jgi:diguanylate cyclase (GGDEF)-like protein/PAS domain S-box-containing protein